LALQGQQPLVADGFAFDGSLHHLAFEAKDFSDKLPGKFKPKRGRGSFTRCYTIPHPFGFAYNNYRDYNTVTLSAEQKAIPTKFLSNLSVLCCKTSPPRMR
jgi:hypothetical protein